MVESMKKSVKNYFTKDALKELEEVEEEEVVEKEDKICDACKADTQYILNKILEALAVYKTLTLTFNKNELEKVLGVLCDNYYTLQELDFMLSVDQDLCMIKFTRK